MGSLENLTAEHAGVLALAAGLIALISLLVAAVAQTKLRRVRRAQRLVLGDLGSQDIVQHSSDLTQRFEELDSRTASLSKQLIERVEAVERQTERTLSLRSVVRYNAYRELSGYQSASIALLDSSRSGIVLSAILHRDQARLYVKTVLAGEGTQPLSPEEQEAVKTASPDGATAITLDS